MISVIAHVVIVVAFIVSIYAGLSWPGVQSELGKMYPQGESEESE